jgi:hypothetical protein
MSIIAFRLLGRNIAKQSLKNPKTGGSSDHELTKTFPEN